MLPRGTTDRHVDHRHIDIADLQPTLRGLRGFKRSLLILDHRLREKGISHGSIATMAIAVFPDDDFGGGVIDAQFLGCLGDCHIIEKDLYKQLLAFLLQRKNTSRWSRRQGRWLQSPIEGIEQLLLSVISTQNYYIKLHQLGAYIIPFQIEIQDKAGGNGQEDEKKGIGGGMQREVSPGRTYFLFCFDGGGKFKNMGLDRALTCYTSVGRVVAACTDLQFLWRLENNLYKYNLSRINSNMAMLSISDLNYIIKYYALRIQQRMEELQHIPTFLPDSPDQQDYDFISLIAKYAHYATSEEREIKLAKKLVARVLQIFQFFKGRSNSQNLLAIIQTRIERELQMLVAPVPIKLGELLSYVHLLTRRGCVVRPPAQKKRLISRPIIIKDNKNQERAPNFSFFNLQKRVTSAGASNKQLRTSTNPPPTALQPERWKLDDVLALWSGMDLDRGHIGRIKDSSEQLLLKDALRRNERLMTLARKQQKRKNRRAITEVSDQCGILMEVKTNSLKPGWPKKRRWGLPSRKKHNSIKENVSILV